MSLLVQLLITFVVFAIVFYLLQRYVAPLMPPPWGNALLALAALLAVVYLLSIIGILPPLSAT